MLDYSHPSFHFKKNIQSGVFLTIDERITSDLQLSLQISFSLQRRRRGKRPAPRRCAASPRATKRRKRRSGAEGGQRGRRGRMAKIYINMVLVVCLNDCLLILVVFFMV